MPLWNDGSLFDYSPKDSDGDNQDNDGLSTESDIDNQERPNDENRTKDINTVGPSINTASSNINIASLIVNTVRLSDDLFGVDNDMRSFNRVELDISNISTIYPVPTTPNTRINKDHSLDNMDIKSAFLYGKIKEEVYVCQPTGFKDPDYPDKVYKVEKALYGLHQAPRACYETMANYLLDNRFCKGKIDQTLFIKRQKEDILLIQVYVDDIIFRSTKKELCTELEVLMHDKFQISSMGELTFFLGLQVKQKSYGIFISHDKYVDEILRKFKYEDVKPVSTPMDKEKALLKDSYGDDVDVHLYRSMIGSLMYLTSSRPDTMFVCKKKTVVATFTTKAEYVAAASCCSQVLWIQNQLLDYGLTFAGEAHHIWLSLILDKKMIKYELSNGFLSHSHNRPKARTLIELYSSHQSLMANLEFCDKHNMVAFLKKPQGSEDFHQIVDFLKASHIRYALTENLTIHVSLIIQFWRTASVRTLDNGEIEINATVDGHDKTIIEASARRHLKLADAEIFKQLALMGYVTDSDKLTFQKGHFSPQWRFLIHTILHCLSPEKTSWEQFSSNIAIAKICLAINRRFNYSKLIFYGMVKNLENKYKFMIYPRFLQMILNKDTRLNTFHKRLYIAPALTQKVFSNIKRESRGFSGVETILFPTMLVTEQVSQGEDEAINKEMHDGLGRAATTVSRLEAD
nr:putative ribonuclease H-like domain-containing protein [Tanacetum cinerariifolium]